MSTRIVTVPNDAPCPTPCPAPSKHALFLTEEEALIVLEAFNWISRRTDVRVSFSTHVDLSDEAILPLTLKVKRYLTEKGE